jgi:hypothetical protein
LVLHRDQIDPRNLNFDGSGGSNGRIRLCAGGLGEKGISHLVQRFGAAYLEEMVHFAKTIKEDLGADPNLGGGRAAQDIGLAAFKSTEIKKPVKVIR